MELKRGGIDYSHNLRQSRPILFASAGADRHEVDALGRWWAHTLVALFWLSSWAPIEETDFVRHWRD